MKRERVDYSGFRLNRLREPEFSHLRLLGAWVLYLALFYLAERFIPASACRAVYSPLDAKIPFCEYFVVFYVAWYPLVFFSLAYYLRYDVERFRQLQLYIIVTQLAAIYCYLVFPNRQDLRPVLAGKQNVFSQMVRLIYWHDTNTNVCPSLHVAYSLGVWSVVSKDELVKRPKKIALGILVLGICLSVVFIKQHSVRDIAAAIPVCLLAEGLIYGKYWSRRFHAAWRRET